MVVLFIELGRIGSRIREIEFCFRWIKFELFFGRLSGEVE